MRIIPVPSKRFAIRSSLSPHDLLETLRRELPNSRFTYWQGSDQYRLKMKRKISFFFSNAFKPIVDVHIFADPPGSTLDVKMRFGPFNSFYFYSCLTFGVLLAMCACLSFLFREVNISVPLTGLGILVVFYLIGTGTFEVEAEIAESFLVKVLSTSSDGPKCN